MQYNIHRVGEHGNPYQGHKVKGPFKNKRAAYAHRNTLNKKRMKFLVCRASK